jgi:disulfide bond formation protein DsbB
MNRLKPHHLYSLLAAACLASLVYAVAYLQQQVGLAPCPLCVIQRLVFILFGVTALIAALHRVAGSGRYVYTTLLLIWAAGGALLAVWQVYLTYQPQLASCRISAEERFLNALPLAKWWPALFEAAGDCASVQWTLFGLSVPALSLIVFLVLAAGTVWAARRR